MHTEMLQETLHEPKTISIRIPRIRLPSLQAGILILLILVGILQTVQLYGLNLKIASANVLTGSSESATSTVESTTSSLPDMVGGC